MTTLANDTPRPYELGDTNDVGCIDNDIIYEGAAVGQVAGTGLARPLVAGDKFLGFCLRKIDNTLEGHTGGGVNVHLRTKGEILLPITGCVITDKNLPVYAQDDNAFSFIPTSGSFIGFLKRYVSSGYGIVKFDAGAFKDPNAGFTAATVSTNTTLDATHSGKLICVDTDAVVITLPAVNGMAGIRIMNVGAFGTVAVTVSPNSADMIEGPGITAADDKDIVNTKATACRGDFIDLEYGDANGWVITQMVGTWARES